MKRRFFSLVLTLIFASSVLTGMAPRVNAREGVAYADRPFYQMDTTFHPEKDELTGHMVVTLPEKRNEPQNEVYFRLYPNAFQNWKHKASKPEKPGYIRVFHVKVDGKSVEPDIKETVMKVQLPRPLRDGQSARIEMDFLLHLPRGGMRLNTFKNTAFLAQWYPMLAVRDQHGWHTEPFTTTGDPFYSVMSDFEVTFRLPEGYRVISTGNNKNQPVGSKITIKQDQVRDFAAVLTKDYRAVSGKYKDIQVNLWYMNGMEDVAKPLLEAAVSGMKFYSEKFGPYPYEEVDVVLGETGEGIAGMEYPGLVTSIPKIGTKKGIQPAVNVVVHELAHQWWYGVVGNNQAKEPWLDEGLTTFSEFLYMEEKMKEDERELLKRASKKADEIHQTAGISSAQPLYDYPEPVYGLMVYIRPAAMLYELMDDIGKEKVLEILKTYYHRYQYKVATTRDFIRTANEVAGKDLTPFFQKWLYFKEA
jgi:hypothetical protein